MDNNKLLERLINLFDTYDESVPINTEYIKYQLEHNPMGIIRWLVNRIEDIMMPVSEYSDNECQYVVTYGDNSYTHRGEYCDSLDCAVKYATMLRQYYKYPFIGVLDLFNNKFIYQFTNNRG